jgi:hypothetical protein
VCRVDGYIGSIYSGLSWRIGQRLARRCIGSVGVGFVGVSGLSGSWVCRIGEGRIGAGRIGEQNPTLPPSTNPTPIDDSDTPTPSRCHNLTCSLILICCMSIHCMSIFKPDGYTHLLHRSTARRCHYSARDCRAFCAA